jgi:hypothetical protein
MYIRNNLIFIFTVLILISIIAYSGYRQSRDRASESRNLNNGSTLILEVDDQKLLIKGSSDKIVSDVKIIAVSAQDGNAVVEIDRRTTVFSVGDKVAIGGNNYLVLQIASHQLALRSIDGHNQNDIFLIKKDLSSGESTMLRVSSDVAVEFPVSGTPNINSN